MRYSGAGGVAGDRWEQGKHLTPALGQKVELWLGETYWYPGWNWTIFYLASAKIVKKSVFPTNLYLPNASFSLGWINESAFCIALIVWSSHGGRTLYHLKMQEKQTANWDIWLLHLLRKFPTKTDRDRFVSCTYAEFSWLFEKHQKRDLTFPTNSLEHLKRLKLQSARPGKAWIHTWKWRIGKSETSEVGMELDIFVRWGTIRTFQFPR